jgi:hypothetical protein
MNLSDEVFTALLVCQKKGVTIVRIIQCLFNLLRVAELLNYGM